MKTLTKEKQDKQVPIGYRHLFTYEEYVNRGWKEVHDSVNK